MKYKNDGKNIWKSCISNQLQQVKDILHEVSIMNLHKTTESKLKEDVEQAIKEMKRHKAPEIDAIPAELLKAGGETLISLLHNLFNKIYNAEIIPDGRGKGIIMPI